MDINIDSPRGLEKINRILEGIVEDFKDLGLQDKSSKDSCERGKKKSIFLESSF